MYDFNLGNISRSRDLTEKKRIKGNVMRCATFYSILMVSIGISGCEPKNDLHVKNNFVFPIIVLEEYQNEDKKPVTIVVGRVAPHRNLMFSRAIQRLTDPLILIFQDPSGKVVGRVEKTFDEGFSRSADRWDVTAGP